MRRQPPVSLACSSSRPTNSSLQTFSHSSKGRLTAHDLERFTGDTLFDRVARTVCEAGCLPRKELFEAWEVARRARRLFRGGRIVDLAAGHGLLAHILLILDRSSPHALIVDTTLPASSGKLHEALAAVWPQLGQQIIFDQRLLQEVELKKGDLVVSAHACGALADLVLNRAGDARARVAVLPCCHDLAANDAGPLAGWMDGPLAIDALRAIRLEQRGYRVWTQTIPPSITPKNRLLLGEPER